MKKSIVKAVRITEDLDALLETDAAEKGITPGTLLSTILKKYAEWDRFAERYGLVSINKQILRKLVEIASDDEIKNLGTEAGKYYLDRTMFWYKQVNLEYFTEMLKNSAKYGGITQLDYENLGDNHVITLRHDFGRKWSLYLAELVRTALSDAFAVTPLIETSESSVDIRFRGPAPKIR